ncbi:MULTISPECIES: heavy metal translocating P-type ATPase [unclassified Tolypothrix]|uniref:heavy metal translocating P-type ATPase n=1 Tax=unclassified Tolypothrix TaxID=2649714 RepID=UPI0005EAC7E4|nr:MULTISPECIES: heavy metal translocating P-type ATPase [unclassified Tolypothrix]BAY92992.1 heavy metal translocating P-type ATPase [Microchaete diplosiphon NIES-3275]EKF03113.1 copper-translocating P-type ATPase [Tolypothrix sp. PCC 7601]MBE9083807.1 copper-translocating P-type ATPase [Tolypothrix sp. LEGE 11397]UYD26887.1 copper-translocating P-type ATPase [Tolypothrix sp. PCC 7712]UYD37256.1 copper-translocating P-type ATPase [Tolypothrix sp. PCC 7601]
MQLVPKTNLTPEMMPITEKIILDVGGMKCAGCVKAVERQLTQHPGVKSACVNLATEVAVVESEVGVVDAEQLAKHLSANGFPTQPRTAASASTREDPEARQHREMHSALKQLVVAGLLLVFSAIGHFGTISGSNLPILNNIWFHCGLATVAILFPGRPILVDGWLGWRRNAPNMNTLIGLGTLTAYTASLVALLFPQMGWECFFDEPVMMLGFILLGRTLEQQARGRAAAAFRQLLALQPQIARLIANPEKIGQESNGAGRDAVIGSASIEIPAEQVRVGEWLQILPGDKIPVDGEVRWGQTTVDESMLTGEAVPVIKQPGDFVTAGTINQSGAIAIQATRTGSDTTLAHIVALVEDAQTRKAPVQKLADTVAGYFTYGVLAAASLTFVFWYFFGVHIWPDIAMSTSMEMAHHSPLSTQHSALTAHYSPLLISLKLAIAVMVVACPCALGLATPTAILVGTGLGAERGLLIKGGDVLERVHQLDTVVFDKTGTLTTGNPTVTDCLLIEELASEGEFSLVPNPQSLLQFAAAVESGTFHPLAKAIQQEAQRQELTIPEAVEFHTEPGLGVSAVVQGKNVLLGNWEWLSWHGIAISETAQQLSQKLAAEGKTVVCVAVGGILTGIIGVADTLRPDAKATVDKLRQMGLRVMLLSGDRQEAASAIGKQLGLSSDDVIAGVPPSKKAAAIQSLQAGEMTNNSKPQAIVAMVGDGINDAPALSQADVGIALYSGSDVAMETAAIVLMRDRLSDVVESIHLSRATFNKIRQNLFWAFAYNTIGIPLAAGVLLPSLGFLLSPSGAAALMAFSSVSVVSNSVLLRRLAHRP